MSTRTNSEIWAEALAIAARLGIDLVKLPERVLRTEPALLPPFVVRNKKSLGLNLKTLLLTSLRSKKDDVAESRSLARAAVPRSLFPAPVKRPFHPRQVARRTLIRGAPPEES